MSTHTAAVPIQPAATDRTDPTGRTDARSWLAVASVALGSFVLVLSEFLPIGLLPAISSDLDVSIGTAGLVVVATGLAAAVSAPVVTIASSSVDRRRVLLALSAALVVADVLGAVAPNFTVLLVARVLLGAALGGFWAIGAAVASRLVQPGSVIRATSFITAGISVATVVSLPLGALVSSLASWRLAFAIGAVLALVSLVGQLVLLPKIPSVLRVRASTLVALLRVPRARIGLIGTAFVFFAQFAAYTFVSPYLEQSVRLDPAAITLALLVFGVAGVAGNFLAGFALGRSITTTVIGAMAIAAVSIILLPLVAGSSTAAFLFLALWGVIWGGLPLAMQTWVIDSAPAVAEGGLALFVTTIQISIAAGSTFGAIAVSSAGITFDFWLAGAIAGVGAVTVLVLVLGMLGVRRAG